MGANAIGVNCSLGPKALAPIVEEYLKYASVPVLLKPNAGLPCSHCGKTHYDVTAEDFAAEVSALVKKASASRAAVAERLPNISIKRSRLAKTLLPWQ